MAAVFRRIAADKRRLPKRFKAVSIGHRGEAAVQRIDEDQSPAAVHSEIVKIEIAGGMGGSGYEQRVMAVIGLSRDEAVLEAPDLITRGEMKAAGRRANPHGALE